MWAVWRSASSSERDVGTTKGSERLRLQLDGPMGRGLGPEHCSAEETRRIASISQEILANGPLLGASTSKEAQGDKVETSGPWACAEKGHARRGHPVYRIERALAKSLYILSKSPDKLDDMLDSLSRLKRGSHIVAYDHGSRETSLALSSILRSGIFCLVCMPGALGGRLGARKRAENDPKR